jgi:hypothetical protein
MGNCGNTVDHWCLQAAVILWPIEPSFVPRPVRDGCCEPQLNGWTMRNTVAAICSAVEVLPAALGPSTRTPPIADMRWRSSASTTRDRYLAMSEVYVSPYSKFLFRYQESIAAERMSTSSRGRTREARARGRRLVDSLHRLRVRRLRSLGRVPDIVGAAVADVAVGEAAPTAHPQCHRFSGSAGDAHDGADRKPAQAQIA